MIPLYVILDVNCINDLAATRISDYLINNSFNSFIINIKDKYYIIIDIT